MIGGTLEYLLLFLIIIAFAIRTPMFQTWLAQRLAGYYSSELNTEVSIGKVDIDLMEHVYLDEVYIEDLHGDTLIYAHKMETTIKGFNLNKKKVQLGNIGLYNPNIKLRQYSGEDDLNLQFLLDYFASEEEDTTANEWRVTAHKLNIYKGHFKYDVDDADSAAYGIDFNHINLSNLNLGLKQFGIKADTIYADVDNISFREHSGFDLKNLRSKIEVSPRGILLDDLYFLTNNTEISTDFLNFNTKSYTDFDDFINKVDMRVEFLEPSNLQLSDLAYFVPELEGVNQYVELKGLVAGRINNIKTKDLFIGLSPETYLYADIDISGLPDIENTFIAVSVEDLRTNKSEIEELPIPPFTEKNHLELDQNMSKLGDIHFSGSFMGFYNDFVAFGDFRTDIGRLKTDIAFKLDTAGTTSYSGKLAATNFNLGYLYNVKEMGSITAEVRIDSASGLDRESLHAVVNGNISQFELNDYNYKNFKLAGAFENNFFIGKVNLNDPNILLDFDGNIDFSGRLPKFDFKARVQEAKLYSLNLSDRDPYASLCFSFDSDAVGNNLDNFSGVLDITDVSYYERGHEHNFDEIHIETYESGSAKTLYLESDAVVANIYGQFNFENLGSSFNLMVSNIFPSLFEPEDRQYKAYMVEDFDFGITFEDPDKITNLLMPDLKIAPYTGVNGKFSTIYDEIVLEGGSDYVHYGDMRLNDLRYLGEKQGDIVFLDITAGKFQVSDSVGFKNIKLGLIPWMDNMSTTLSWRNDSTVWGKIRGEGTIYNMDRFDFLVKPSEFMVEAKKWEIKDSALITFDTTAIDVRSLTVSSGYESICVDGKATEIESDQIKVSLNKFNLANLNPLIKSEGLEVDGEINGDAAVGNIYDTLYFSSDLLLDSLALNKEYVGNLELANVWENETKTIHLGGTLIRDGFEKMGISGRYFTQRKKENFNIKLEFDSTDLAFVNGFIPQEDVSEFAAFATGQIRLTGSPSEPKLNGSLKLDGGAIKANYLNTKYFFKGNLTVYPDMFALDYIPIHYNDKLGNGKKQSGYLSGSVIHNNFSDWNYDFYAEVNNFLLMNTNYEMNPWYYGKAYGSGTATIFGYDENIEITVNIKSEKNTEFYLPLYGDEDVVLKDFVSFVGDEKDTIDYQVDLEGITMNFDMEVTEDANVQILFDPAIGDIMEGRAKGNLNLKINPLGDFEMFGDLEVVEGEYLFTFYNVINKKFRVQEGGTISWKNGDPYDAVIDLTTIYEVKAPLYDIMSHTQNAEKYKTNYEVLCIMNLKEDLYNPVIDFDIKVPRGDGKVESALNRVRQDDQELSKQVFSLMVINKFMPLAGTAGGTASGFGNVGTTTTAELLNNQLSNWLSQVSEEFDLGFNYRPGDEISNEEIALAFETQLFNDRLILSGNFGVSYGAENNQNPNALIGDFDAEYIMNEDGTFRIRAFNESNEFDLTNTSQAPFTQGVGLFYTEEFDSLGEVKLIKKIGNFFKGGKDKKENEEGNTQPNDESIKEEEIQ